MTNEFLIGMTADGKTIQLLRPIPRQMTKDQALTLAAWIVAIADPTGQQFEAKLQEVRGC